MDKTFTLEKNNITTNTIISEATQSNITACICEPDPRTVNSILNYSKSLLVTESKLIKQMEVVLS